jgi:hypothetical protein
MSSHRERTPSSLPTAVSRDGGVQYWAEARATGRVPEYETASLCAGRQHVAVWAEGGPARRQRWFPERAGQAVARQRVPPVRQAETVDRYQRPPVRAKSELLHVVVTSTEPPHRPGAAQQAGR